MIHGYKWSRQMETFIPYVQSNRRKGPQPHALSPPPPLTITIIIIYPTGCCSHEDPAGAGSELLYQANWDRPRRGARRKYCGKSEPHLHEL